MTPHSLDELKDQDRSNNNNNNNNNDNNDNNNNNNDNNNSKSNSNSNNSNLSYCNRLNCSLSKLLLSVKDLYSANCASNVTRRKLQKSTKIARIKIEI